MRIVRSSHAHARLLAIDTAGGAGGKGRRRGVDACGYRRSCRRSISAKDRSRRSRPYRQPVLARDRVRYVGEPVAAVFAADPYGAEDAADLVAVAVEELPPLLDAAAAPGEFAPGRHHRSHGRAQILWRCRGGVPRRLRRGRARSGDRPAFGRAARDARRHRALRRGARRARAARRRQGAAPHPRRARPHARARAGPGASARGPCRRRLRRARRALSRGRARLRRGASARPAGQMDRGPARASHRHQPFAPAAPPRARRGRSRRTHPRHRRRVLPRPGRLYPHPRRSRPRTDRRACWPGPTACRRSRSIGHFRLTNKTPAATYRAPGRFEGSFVRERLVDAVAARLGLDPVDGAPPQPHRRGGDAVRPRAARARRPRRL